MKIISNLFKFLDNINKRIKIFLKVKLKKIMITEILDICLMSLFYSESF